MDGPVFHEARLRVISPGQQQAPLRWVRERSTLLLHGLWLVNGLHDGSSCIYHWSLVYPGILDKLLSLTINSFDWNKSLISFVLRFRKALNYLLHFQNILLRKLLSLIHQWRVVIHHDTMTTGSTWSPATQLQSMVLHHLPTTQRSAKVVCVLVSKYSLTIFQLWIIPGSSIPC